MIIDLVHCSQYFFLFFVTLKNADLIEVMGEVGYRNADKAHRLFTQAFIYHLLGRQKHLIPIIQIIRNFFLLAPKIIAAVQMQCVGGRIKS
ncbi:MAG: hypothetical protein WC901_05285 [Candidatus Margulisiibacteriota bacterium]